MKKLNQKVNEFITTTVKRDNSAKDEINKAKKDFYTQYSYLKPECEKNFLDGMVDGVKKLGEWCKENWKELVSVVAVLAVVIALVVISIATFGAGAVILAGLVGALVGIASQFISDVVSWQMTGNWDADWREYLGSVIGGSCRWCINVNRKCYDCNIS